MTATVKGLLVAILLAALLGLTAGVPASAAGDGVLVIRGATIQTVTNGDIEDGVVVVEGGKIIAVGPAGEVAIPEGATVREAAGQVLIPGLVDTHSHVGVYPRPGVRANSDGNEMTGPIQSLVRAMDSIFPADPGIKMALAGGVTTANIMPGSGNPMGGQCAYVKLRGATVEEMLIDLGDHAGGMKMANGENPKGRRREEPRAPSTRMAIAALQRETFIRAQEYRDRWARYEKKKADDPDARMPDRDLGLDPVVEILDRKRTVHHHTHRADDILTVMRIADEFGYEVVLQHVTEAWLVADEIAKRQVPVSLIIVESPGGKHEAVNLRLDNPAICERAGVKVALHTDDWITHSRLFLRTGALAVRGGMTPEGALKALTIHPAEMMHLEDRVGSIEVGKDGDLVLLSGDPFSAYTKVLATYIEGELVFDRSRAEDLRYATGGFWREGRLPGEPLPHDPMPEPAARPDGEQGDPGDGRFAVRAGRLWTGDGEPIADGVVLVEDGLVRQAGAAADVPVPEGWPVLTAAEVTPGLIDTHSTVGLTGLYNVPADQDHSENTDPDQASLRVIDGFNPREPLLDYLLQHGITVIQVAPGPDNPIAGQAAILRTHGETMESMLVESPSALFFNLGERPKEVYGSRRQMPSTRMGTAAYIRRALTEARNYAAHRERAEGGDDEPEEGGDDPESERRRRKSRRDLKKEALLDLLEGRVPAVFVAHREDDILTAVRLAAEFGIERYSISQAAEAYLVADRLAEAKVPVLVGPVLQTPGSLETMNALYENAGLLRKAGVTVTMTSGYEGYVPKTHVVLFEAALAAAHGLGREGAMRALTSEAARVLGIDDRHGTLAPGKVADLVLFDGDPFEYTSHVDRVVAGGQVVFERPR